MSPEEQVNLRLALLNVLANTAAPGLTAPGLAMRVAAFGFATCQPETVTMEMQYLQDRKLVELLPAPAVAGWQRNWRITADGRDHLVNG